MRLDLLVSPVIVPILRYNDISLAYFEVFEGLAMSPEEGKCIEVHISFNGQTFKFPEEGLRCAFCRQVHKTRVIIAKLPARQSEGSCHP